MLAPFVLALVKVAMFNMMGQMVILYLMDVLYSYGLCTVVEESSGDESSWSADERRHRRMEHLREQHLAGNYHTENCFPTPPLDFPTSSDEDEDDEHMDIDEDCNKKAKNCSRPSKKVVGPLRIARGADTDQDVAEQVAPSLKPGRIPNELVQKAKAFGLLVTEEAQHLADEYGKPLATIMTAAGLSTKVTRNESIWNVHQAWYANAHPKVSDGKGLNSLYPLMLMRSQRR